MTTAEPGSNRINCSAGGVALRGKDPNARSRQGPGGYWAAEHSSGEMSLFFGQWLFGCASAPWLVRG